MRRETFSTSAPPRVVVRLASGEIEVETVDGDETVVQLEGLNDRGREAVEEASIVQRGDEIRVDVDRRSFFVHLGRAPEVRAIVQTPHGASLEVGAAAAEVRGVGRFADVEVKTAAGDVKFDQIERDASINSVSGGVQLSRVGGRAIVKAVSGDVRIGEAGGDVEVNSVSGDVAIDALAPGNSTVKTVSGEIRAGVPRGLALWVDAKSLSGKTVSELDVGDERPGADQPLVELRAKSVSGDIRVVRASSVPA